MSIRIEAIVRRLTTRPAPKRREPWLLRARQSARAIVVSDLSESGCGHEFTPLFEIVISSVTFAAPSLLIVPAGIGAEEHAVGFQCLPQCLQSARQFLARDMKKRGISENPVEEIFRQF